MRRGSVLVTPPTSKPITQDDLVRQLRLPENDDPTALSLYIDTAIDMAQEYLGIAFITQQWRLSLDDFPCSQERWWDGVREMHINELRTGYEDITLPRYPLVSVDTMTVDGQAITVSDYFNVDTDRKRGRLSVKFGETLPVVTQKEANTIQITYTAGYSSKDDVPASLRMGLILIASYLYENRGECSAEDALMAGKASLDRYKVYDL